MLNNFAPERNDILIKMYLESSLSNMTFCYALKAGCQVCSNTEKQIGINTFFPFYMGYTLCFIRRSSWCRNNVSVCLDIKTG